MLTAASQQVWVAQESTIVTFLDPYFSYISSIREQSDRSSIPRQIWPLFFLLQVQSGDSLRDSQPAFWEAPAAPAPGAEDTARDTRGAFTTFTVVLRAQPATSAKIQEKGKVAFK